MPGGGIAAVGSIKTRVPGTAAVLLAQRADADELIDALRAGASGYVLETTGPAGIASRAPRGAARRGRRSRASCSARSPTSSAPAGLRRRVTVPGRPVVELTRRQSRCSSSCGAASRPPRSPSACSSRPSPSDATSGLRSGSCGRRPRGGVARARRVRELRLYSSGGGRQRSRSTLSIVGPPIRLRMSN